VARWADMRKKTRFNAKEVVLAIAITICALIAIMLSLADR